MKVMRNFVTAVVRVWNMPFVKYAVITVLGFVFVGIVGENSLLAHLRNKHYIGQLTEEINKYNARYKSDMRQIHELNHNPKAMERIARERYFMKHDDEDIFVLSDDNREFQSLAANDEAAE